MRQRSDFDRQSLFRRKERLPAAVWLGTRTSFLAVDTHGEVLGAVVCPADNSAIYRIFSFRAHPRSTDPAARRRFADTGQSTLDLRSVFDPNVFAAGRAAAQLIEPATRRVVISPPQQLDEHMTQRRKTQLSSPSPTSPPPPPPATDSVTLSDAMTVLASVKSAYADYELDAHKLLAFPALIDPDEPLTAAWYEAFDEARALEPEDPAHYPPDRAARFVAAAVSAEQAWEAAESNARQLALGRLDPDQRNRIRRARRTLDLALDPATPAGERQNALAATLDLLNGIITLPAPAHERLRLAVTERGRPHLPAVHPPTAAGPAD